MPSPPTRGASPNIAAKTAAKTGSKTVMIVEDNPLNMKLFADLLEVSGYRTLRFTEGTNARERALEHRPDLLLIDVQLPHKSGLEIIGEVKATPEIADIPAVAVTAFAMKGDEDKVRQAGFDDYISKPIVVKDFLEKVKRYIGDG